MKQLTSAAKYGQRAAAIDHDDEDDDGTPTQRTVPAGAARGPVGTTAPSSVFDAGRKALQAARDAGRETRRARAANTPAIPADQIVIRKGIPKPPPVNIKAPGYTSVVAQMQPGDSVELPARAAKSFYTAAKKYGAAATPPRKYSIRTLDADTGAVWRDA